MTEPRAYTEEEIRDMFLNHISVMCKYWSEIRNGHHNTELSRMEGLAFSILVLLDGGTELPGFKVIPCPHEDDKQFCIDNEENWFPDDCDIGGGLHEYFGNYRRA